MAEEQMELLVEFCEEDEFSREDVLDAITPILQEAAPEGRFFCEVKNFGWRSLNGYTFVNLVVGYDIVVKVLPKTQCNFKLFRQGNLLKIQNYHHDSPMGNEWYTLVPVSAEQFDNEEIPEIKKM